MAQAKEVRGPGPRMGGPRPKVENPGKLLKRIGTIPLAFANPLPSLQRCRDAHHREVRLFDGERQRTAAPAPSWSCAAMLPPAG